MQSSYANRDELNAEEDNEEEEAAVAGIAAVAVLLLDGTEAAAEAAAAAGVACGWVENGFDVFNEDDVVEEATAGTFFRVDDDVATLPGWTCAFDAAVEEEDGAATADDVVNCLRLDRADKLATVGGSFADADTGACCVSLFDGATDAGVTFAPAAVATVAGVGATCTWPPPPKMLFVVRMLAGFAALIGSSSSSIGPP